LRMEPTDVAAAVEAVGFKPLTVIELPPYHYAATFRKVDRASAELLRRRRLTLMKKILSRDTLGEPTEIHHSYGSIVRMQKPLLIRSSPPGSSSAPPS
jgi:hypothetical protein